MTSPTQPLTTDSLASPGVDDASDWFAEHRRSTAMALSDLQRDHAIEAAKLTGAHLGDPQGVLLHRLSIDLVSAGFTLHDCATRSSTGGVCLTPTSSGRGVIVSWTTHHALAVATHRYVVNSAVHEVMNYAVADALTVMGWHLDAFGQASAHLVTAAPPTDSANHHHSTPDTGGPE